MPQHTSEVQVNYMLLECQGESISGENNSLSLVNSTDIPLRLDLSSVIKMGQLIAMETDHSKVAPLEY